MSLTTPRKTRLLMELLSSPTSRLRRLLAPLVWSLYLAWRAPGWGWFSGIPLCPFAAAVLVTIWWLWWLGGRRLPFTGVIIVLAAIKIVTSAALLEHGLLGAYYANDSWRGAPERGLYVRDGSATRVDQRLAFGTPGGRDLPVFFFNDVSRFNFYQPNEPVVEQLAYSVIWSGSLQVTQGDTNLTFYLVGPGAAARLEIDGFPLLQLDPAESTKFTRVRLRPGSRRLVVKLSGTYGAPRRLEAGLVDASGHHRPFDTANVISSHPAPWRIAVDRAVATTAGLVDLAVLGTLAAAAFLILGDFARSVSRDWQRTFVAGWASGAVAEAFWALRGFNEHFIQLAGGQDWLTYESYARDIAIYGPWMTMGRTIGQGAPFYFQPLYPYFLGLTHLAFGESLWGALFLQRLLLSVTVYAVWRIGQLLFGDAAGVAALGVSGWFVWTKVEWLSSTFLGEILFIPLLALWTLSLCRIAANPPRFVPAGAAIWGGLSTLSRSTVLLAWPLIALPIVASYRRARRSLLPLAAALIIALGVVGLATLRNAVVARQVVPITSSFGVNFYLGNLPPPGTLGHEPELRRWLERISSDPRAVDTLEYATTAPRLFLGGLRRKAAFAFGWLSVLDPVNSPEPDRELIAAWAAALVGIVLTSRAGEPRAARWIPLLVSLSHLASVVLIFPHGYGTRLILPFYVLLTPYAGLALATAVAPVWRAARRLSRRS